MNCCLKKRILLNPVKFNHHNTNLIQFPRKLLLFHPSSATNPLSSGASNSAHRATNKLAYAEIWPNLLQNIYSLLVETYLHPPKEVHISTSLTALSFVWLWSFLMVGALCTTKDTCGHTHILNVIGIYFSIVICWIGLWGRQINSSSCRFK